VRGVAYLLGSAPWTTEAGRRKLEAGKPETAVLRYLGRVKRVCFHDMQVLGARLLAKDVNLKLGSP
jgi:hypothetical protein